MALGPLLEGRETRSPDGIPVTRLVLFQQPVTYQKLDATLANLDRRHHDNAPWSGARGGVLHGRGMLVQYPFNCLLL